MPISSSTRIAASWIAATPSGGSGSVGRSGFSGMRQGICRIACAAGSRWRVPARPPAAASCVRSMPGQWIRRRDARLPVPDESPSISPDRAIRRPGGLVGQRRASRAGRRYRAARRRHAARDRRGWRGRSAPRRSACRPPGRCRDHAALSPIIAQASGAMPVAAQKAAACPAPAWRHGRCRSRRRRRSGRAPRPLQMRPRRQPRNRWWRRRASARREQPVEQRGQRRRLDLRRGGGAVEDMPAQPRLGEIGAAAVCTASTTTSIVPAIIGLVLVEAPGWRGRSPAPPRARRRAPRRRRGEPRMKPALQAAQVALKSNSVPSLSKTIPQTCLIGRCDALGNGLLANG